MDNKMYFHKQKEIINEGQHLPQADVQACPHACFFLLDLLISYVDPIPDPKASCYVACKRDSIPLWCSSL